MLNFDLEGSLQLQLFPCNKIYNHVRITRRYLRTSVLRINQADPVGPVSFAPIKPGWYVTRVILTATVNATVIVFVSILIWFCSLRTPKILTM